MKTAFKVTKDVMPGEHVSVYARGRYQRTYKPGAVVEAKSGTIGILLFEDLTRAITWANLYEFGSVFEVELLDEVRNIRNVSGTQGEDDLDLWYKDGCPSELAAPNGTIACQKVKVLSLVSE